MPNTKDGKTGNNHGSKSSERGSGSMDQSKQGEMAGKGGKASRETRNDNESSQRRNDSREGGR